MGDLEWRIEDGDYISRSENPLQIDKMTIEFETPALAKEAQISVLNGGGVWEEVSSTDSYTVSGAYVWSTGSKEIYGIRIHTAKKAIGNIILNFYVKQGTAQKNGSDVLEKTLGHVLSYNSAFAMDNDYATSWNSEGQKEQIVFDIELKEIMDISGIRLDPGKKTGDIVENPHIFISEDGEFWKEITDYETRDNVLFTFSSRSCPLIRFITTEEKEENWNISEVEAYKELQ